MSLDKVKHKKSIAVARLYLGNHGVAKKNMQLIIALDTTWKMQKFLPFTETKAEIYTLKYMCKEQRNQKKCNLVLLSFFNQFS